MDLFFWHGVLMTAAFGVLCPLSVVVAKARRGKSALGRNWFNWHVGLHTGATLCAVAAVLLLVFGLPAGHRHFSSPHAWIGLALLAGVTLLQPTLGLNEDSQPAARQRSLRLHRKIGQLLAILAGANVLFGCFIWFQ